MRRIIALCVLITMMFCSCSTVKTSVDTESVPPETEDREEMTDAVTEPPKTKLPSDPLLYEEIPDDVSTLVSASSSFNQSGTLQSATGTSMNLIIEWKARHALGNDSIIFDAEISLVHERIKYPGTIGTLKIGEKDYVFKTPFFDYTAEALTENRLTSVSMVIPYKEGETLMLEVSAYWGYKGDYKNTELDGVKIDAVIPLGASYANIPRKTELEPKVILQNPYLPEGCEVTSLAILLNYFGFNIAHTELSDKYLPKGKAGEVSFYEYNLGDPRNGGAAWGCYSPVIVKTANSYLCDMDTNYRAYDYTGYDVCKLYYEIAYGRPVIVWVTMDFEEPYTKSPWVIDGKKMYWKYPLHCVVISGYDLDAETVTLTDPLSKNPVKVEMSLFERRFRQMESQAVTIKPSVSIYN